MKCLRVCSVSAVVAATAAMLAAASQPQQLVNEPISRAVQAPTFVCGQLCGRPVSPDGRYLAYFDRQAGKGVGMSIRDLSSGQRVVVVADTPDAYPSQDLVWSHDSKRLAYRWINSAGNEETGELRSIAADGSDTRTLAPDGLYAGIEDWSPDGASLLVTMNVKDKADPHSQTAVLFLASGSRRVIGRAIRNAFFSPDGRRIVYTQLDERSRVRHVRLVNTSGDEDRALAAAEADEAAIGWSPDGRDALFTKNEDLWAVRIDDATADGQPRLLKRNIGLASGMGVTTGGDVFYKVAVNWKVFRVPLDPATSKVIGTPTRIGVQTSDWQERPAWSPDGRELAFKTGEGGRLLAIVSIDTGQQREIHPGIESVSQIGLPPFSWTADGRAFFVDGGPNPVGVARPKGAYRVDARTGEATMVISKSVNPVSVSHVHPLPDGHSVIYLDTWRRVVVRDLESGDEGVVYDGGATWALDSLALSPDGRTAALRDSQKGLVQVVPLSGGSPRSIAPIKAMGNQQALIVWSGDGRFLIYASQKPDAPGYELWRVPVGGGEPERIGLASDSEIANVVVRPGGRELAVVMHSGEPAGVRVLEKLVPAAIPSQQPLPKAARGDPAINMAR